MTLFINICERQKYVENKCKERKAKAKTKHKKKLYNLLLSFASK